MTVMEVMLIRDNIHGGTVRGVASVGRWRLWGVWGGDGYGGAMGDGYGGVMGVMVVGGRGGDGYGGGWGVMPSRVSTVGGH